MENAIKDRPVLEVENLYVEYHSNNMIVKAVNGVSLKLYKGQTIGLVGETGAGKTTTALALMRLLPERVGRLAGGTIKVKGDDIAQLREYQMNHIRGEVMSMIFQDPMTALNPIMRVGEQIKETLKLHNSQGLTDKQINKRVEEVLEQVGIPAQRKNDYPIQFSGGMKQRVVIAIAMACNPDILIADEPTTALDVTIQAQVLALTDEMKAQTGGAMIMITHDLGVVARTCDQVGVMYAGELVEFGSLEDVFSPGNHHPYTEGLFGSIPNMRSSTRRLFPIEGLMPDPTDLPAGCSFSSRCPKSMEICKHQKPADYVQNGHTIKCHLFGGEQR